MVLDSDPDPDHRIDLPADFADHLATVGNLDTVPRTLAEYFSQFAAQLDASDQTLAPADLYTEDPTRHEVRVDDRIQYSPCVLDALTAAVLESQSSVTVRSVDPVSGAPVTLTVGDDRLDVTPANAVLSFGIAPAIPALESTDEFIFTWLLDADTPSVSAAFCQYINAFESRATYDRWDGTTDGKTIPVQPAAATGLVRQYIEPD